MRIDFHSHILPGIDDGSESVEQTLRMLQMEAQQGIGHVVATPHFYPRNDHPDRFLERRTHALQQIQNMLADQPDLPTVSVGAEVYYFRGMSDTDLLSNLTISNNQYILLEMPVGDWTASMLKEVEQIYIKQGIVPILAHIDRYINPFNARRVLQSLSDLPVIVQANASFFQKRSTRALALRMLRQKQIHLLGSDCHDLTGRPPNLGQAYDLIEERLGKEAVEFIIHCGTSILQGKFPEVL